MKILRNIRDFIRYKKIKGSFQKDCADINQKPWLNGFNEDELPSWIGGMMTDIEPKFIYYYEKFMKNSKEDLAKRCAWTEVLRQQRDNVKIGKIIKTE